MQTPSGGSSRGYVYVCTVSMPKTVNLSGNRKKHLAPGRNYYQVHYPENYWDTWDLYVLTHGHMKWTKGYNGNSSEPVRDVI